MRMLNKAISPKIYDMWIERNGPLLEWSKDKSRYVLEHEFLPSPDTFDKYILPHEFLFLVPNAWDRIAKISEIYENNLKECKDTSSNLEFEKVDLTGCLDMTKKWLQFKSLLRIALDNRLKGRSIRQDPVSQEDIVIQPSQQIFNHEMLNSGSGNLVEKMFENSRLKSVPNKLSDINLNAKDLRQIMYDANTFLRIANDELAHLSHVGGNRK